MADDIVGDVIAEKKIETSPPVEVAKAPEAAPPVADPKPAATDDAPKAVEMPVEGKDTAPATVLDAPKDTPKESEKEPQGRWGPKWREDIIAELGITDPKELEKELKRLERMSSPAAAYKMAREIERKMSSGEFKKALPENATDEQKAEWRKEQGIPEKPDGYQFPEIKGHEWSDESKTIASGLMKHLHAKDVPQSAVAAALEWYADFEQEQKVALSQVNQKAKESTEDALRDQFGAEYRPNMQLLRRMFDDTGALPEAVSRALVTARHPDGRILLNDPEIAGYLIGLARQQYGDGGILTGDEQSSLSSREEALVKMMHEDPDAYYRAGPNGQKSPADELVELRQRKERSR